MARAIINTIKEIDKTIINDPNIYIDSGNLILVDPCYVLQKEVYKNILEEAWKNNNWIKEIVIPTVNNNGYANVLWIKNFVGDVSPNYISGMKYRINNQYLPKQKLIIEWEYN